MSQLPQPTRRTSPRKMAEMSASQSNARSAIPPPQKVSKLQHPSLMERVEEFPKSKNHSGPTASRAGGITCKATSLTGAARQNDFASSMSSIRPPSSASSRITCNSSFASSVGPGSSYTQNSRPQSALGNSRFQRPNGALHRPSTSMDIHNGPQGVLRPAKRKGMAHFPSLIERPYSPIRSVSSGPFETLSPSCAELKPRPLQPKSMRDISISTAMGLMTIEDHEPYITPPEPVEPLLPPPKRSCIPVRSPSKAPQTESPFKSPRKTPKPILPFLSRDSNVRAATFDPEESYGELESKMTEFMTRMDVVTKEGGEARALADSYKARGTLLYFRVISFLTLLKRLSWRRLWRERSLLTQNYRPTLTG